MKKITAIFFMLCANLVLMAHLVIPHHHHEDIACFRSHFPVEHHDGCEEHHSRTQDQHSDHDKDECSLSDLLAIIPDGFRQEKILNLQAVAETAVAFYSINNERSTELLRGKLMLITIDCQPWLYHEQHYIGCNSALRAPPAC